MVEKAKKQEVELSKDITDEEIKRAFGLYKAFEHVSKLLDTSWKSQAFSSGLAMGGPLAAVDNEDDAILAQVFLYSGMLMGLRMQGMTDVSARIIVQKFVIGFEAGIGHVS